LENRSINSFGEVFYVHNQVDKEEAGPSNILQLAEREDRALEQLQKELAIQNNKTKEDRWVEKLELERPRP